MKSLLLIFIEIEEKKDDDKVPVGVVAGAAGGVVALIVIILAGYKMAPALLAKFGKKAVSVATSVVNGANSGGQNVPKSKAQANTVDRV